MKIICPSLPPEPCWWWTDSAEPLFAAEATEQPLSSSTSLSNEEEAVALAEPPPLSRKVIDKLISAVFKHTCGYLELENVRKLSLNYATILTFEILDLKKRSKQIQMCSKIV